MTVLNVKAEVPAKAATFGSDGSEAQTSIMLSPATPAEPEMAVCVWFTTQGEVRSGGFALPLLKGEEDPLDAVCPNCKEPVGERYAHDEGDHWSCEHQVST